jgi:anti-anti-sigma regulatory factor
VPFAVEPSAGGVRLVVRGPLGTNAIRRMKRELAGLCDDGEAVVLDLSRVTEIDALGFGAILDADSTFTEAGQTFEVVAPSIPAGRTLVLLGSRGRLRVRQEPRWSRSRLRMTLSRMVPARATET